MNNQGSLSGNQVIENQNDYNQILQGWQENDPDITQLNWDLMYNANYNNLYTQNNIENGIINENGDLVNSLTARRSKYIVEEYRLDPDILVLIVLAN